MKSDYFLCLIIATILLWFFSLVTETFFYLYVPSIIVPILSYGAFGFLVARFFNLNSSKIALVIFGSTVLGAVLYTPLHGILLEGSEMSALSGLYHIIFYFPSYLVGGIIGAFYH